MTSWGRGAALGVRPRGWRRPGRRGASAHQIGAHRDVDVSVLLEREQDTYEGRLDAAERERDQGLQLDAPDRRVQPGVRREELRETCAGPPGCASVPLQHTPPSGGPPSPV